MERIRLYVVGLIVAALGIALLIWLQPNRPHPSHPLPVFAKGVPPAARVLTPTNAATMHLAKPTEEPAGGNQPSSPANNFANPVVVNALQSGTNTTSQTTPTPAAPDEVPTPKNWEANENTEGTQRMYLAHASLRMPEVADPDSSTNREVLQAMVQKALLRAHPGKPADAQAR
jgi:hypothetical protein